MPLHELKRMKQHDHQESFVEAVRQDREKDAEGRGDHQYKCGRCYTRRWARSVNIQDLPAFGPTARCPNCGSIALKRIPKYADESTETTAFGTPDVKESLDEPVDEEEVLWEEVFSWSEETL